jgi:hypothetical protein
MSAWPRLDLAADRLTTQACHLVLQLIGKLPLRLLPWTNHGWHLTLRVTPQGYATQLMPGGEGRHFTVTLDVHEAVLRVACENGTTWQAPVPGRTIAQLHADLSGLLAEAGLPAPLHGGPNEVPAPVPFAQDHAPREWNGDAARRLHGAFLAADRAFTRFRSLYLGKSSPSHLFWGAFDLAVTRFSGRAAPPHPGGIPGLSDAVTREAYSHEVISAGFWPGDVWGGTGVNEAAFYAYAYPAPLGLGDSRIAPEAAFWHGELGEFLLPYAAAAEASGPDAALARFLQSTYEAAAGLLDWPSGLAAPRPAYGTPLEHPPGT